MDLAEVLKARTELLSEPPIKWLPGALYPRIKRPGVKPTNALLSTTCLYYSDTQTVARDQRAAPLLLRCSLRPNPRNNKLKNRKIIPYSSNTKILLINTVGEEEVNHQLKQFIFYLTLR